jgi:hypothetical protein
MLYGIAAIGFLVAAAATALPYLRASAPAGVSPSGRAGWVNRLFVLACQADESGEPAVAAAARALISALVAEKELPKKGR